MGEHLLRERSFLRLIEGMNEMYVGLLNKNKFKSLIYLLMECGKYALFIVFLLLLSIIISKRVQN